MPTIMGQNVIRPDIAKPECPVDRSHLPTPRATIDSHPDHHGLNYTTGNRVIQSRTTMESSIVHKAHAINPTLAASTETSKKHSLRVTLSSSSSPTSSISPIRHIRRWTSNLSSSKASRKSNKIRAVSPISASHPLRTPVPFACTPLPYSGSSTATTSPTGTTPPSTYSSLSRSYHTSWKSRLFYSTGKKHDKRARTHSSMEDGTEDMNNRINAKLKNKTTKQTTPRPKMHTSVPLTQPMLPPSQKAVPIPSPLMSSTGDMFGPTSKRKPDNARKRQSTSDSIRSIFDALLMIATTTVPGEMPQTQVHEEHGTMEVTEVPTTKSLEDRRDQVSTSVNSLCKGLETGQLHPQTKVVVEITPRSSSFNDPFTAVTSALDKPPTSRTRKSGAIKTPSSFMTLLPTNIGKDKTSSAGLSMTPPPTPPLDQRLEGMLNDPIAKFPTKTLDLATDPRALTLKRMAYIHTLKKLRERGRRSFRHAVLLHHTLLQLRRGITHYQCEEIGDFYAAMWATQFPARWDKASTMALTQGQNFPHHQQALRGHHSNTNDTLQPSAQQTGKNAGAAQDGKNPKAKPPLVSSFQGRIQSSMVQNSGSGESRYSGDDHTSSNGSETTSTSTILCPSPQRAIQPLPSKKELSSASTSSSPSTETERKGVFDVASTVRRSPPRVSSDSNYDDATTGKRAVHLPPQPMVIIPKRTTGRKGLIYQQQQQLEQLQGENVPSGILSGSVIHPEDRNRLILEQTQMQAQLLGTRSRFATSTFTTVMTKDLELRSRPLVPLSIANSQAPRGCPPGAPRNFLICSIDSVNGVHHHHLPRTRSSASPLALPTFPTAMSASESRVVPPGLLSPPLSPLFRPLSAMPFAMSPPMIVSMQSPNPTANIPGGIRIHQAHIHSTSLGHSQVSNGSAVRSPYSLSYVQDQHNVVRCLDNKVFLADPHRDLNNSRASLEAARQHPPSSRLRSSVAPALPSPPPSPTIDTDATANSSPKGVEGAASLGMTTLASESSMTRKSSQQRKYAF